jgi:hypothetical protein
MGSTKFDITCILTGVKGLKIMGKQFYIYLPLVNFQTTRWCAVCMLKNLANSLQDLKGQLEYSCKINKVGHAVKCAFLNLHINCNNI